MSDGAKDDCAGAKGVLRRSARWTGARRETYLAVLRATGNMRAAAEAIGMDRTSVERRAKLDPEFGRACREALAEADRRLRGRRADEAATGAPAQSGPDPFEVVRRGSNGRLQIAAAGKGRWSGHIEQAFVDHLRRTGNLSASARAAGFSLNSVLDRRRRCPGFARRIEEALEDAEIELEFRLVAHCSDVAEDTGTATSEFRPPFDPEFALKFLKWREEKRRGGGRRGRGDRGPPVPSIEEVTERIVRRVEAIKRHRERFG